MTDEPNNTLGDRYPIEQARMRGLLEEAYKLSAMPGVNMTFYIAMLKATMRDADEAAISGDVVRMIRAYKAMQEIER